MECSLINYIYIQYILYIHHVGYYYYAYFILSIIFISAVSGKQITSYTTIYTTPTIKLFKINAPPPSLHVPAFAEKSSVCVLLQ